MTSTKTGRLAVVAALAALALVGAAAARLEARGVSHVGGEPRELTSGTALDLSWSLHELESSHGQCLQLSVVGHGSTTACGFDPGLPVNVAAMSLGRHTIAFGSARNGVQRLTAEATTGLPVDASLSPKSDGLGVYFVAVISGQLSSIRASSEDGGVTRIDVDLTVPSESPEAHPSS
jgi:hypothetical protein